MQGAKEYFGVKLQVKLYHHGNVRMKITFRYIMSKESGINGLICCGLLLKVY